MLHKKNRIVRELFDEIFAKGRVFHGEYMYMKVATIITDPPQCKFSCVVSKKVAKKAHDRHLIKRRVYSALYQELSHIVGNTHGLIFIKKQEKMPTYAQLAIDIKNILKASKSYI